SGHTADEDVGLLVVLNKRRRRLSCRHGRRPMAEVLQQLPVTRELQDAFASPCSRYPDVAVAIDVDGLFSGPAWHVPGTAPALNQVALWIELEDRWSGDAAIGAWRVCR